MYILKRNTDGKMVAKSGLEQSYTNDIFKARVFNTEAEALLHKCGNEYIEDIGYNQILTN